MRLNWILTDTMDPEKKWIFAKINLAEKWFDVANDYKTAFEKAVAIKQNTNDKSILDQYNMLSNNVEILFQDQDDGGLDQREAQKETNRRPSSKSEFNDWEI